MDLRSSLLTTRRTLISPHAPDRRETCESLNRSQTDPLLRCANLIDDLGIVTGELLGRDHDAAPTISDKSSPSRLVVTNVLAFAVPSAVVLHCDLVLRERKIESGHFPPSLDDAVLGCRSEPFSLQHNS
ncbi:hypothetical protein BAY61_02900 [Prauserella marina]|nr:hypothetical protein BAY61_02900 [Prauserella marina]